MYFSKFLKIPDVKSRFIADRLQLLRDIIRASVLNIPFQNITSFGLPSPGPKPAPTIKGILDSAIRGHGGMCAHNNCSLKMVLESIGYDSYTAAAKFRRNAIPGSHVVCLVKIPPPHSLDGKTEDLYVVDVGCGVPLHEPIRVNNLSVAPYTGRAGGLEFAYELSPDGTVINRVNKGGDALLGEKPMDYLSPQDYTIYLEPKTIVELFPSWAKVYGTPEAATHIHSSFYTFRYLELAPDYSDFKVVCIRGKDLITFTKETRNSQSFKTYDEIEQLVHEYFPEILPHEVSQAKLNFTSIESQEFQRSQPL